MKTFTLKSEYNVLRGGITEVCLRPSDPQIEDYIVTYKIYPNYDDAVSDNPSLLVEQTPIMYHIFHYTDSIPQEIRDQYEL